MKRTSTGIIQRHHDGCTGRGKCGCGWQAWVWSARDGRKVYKTFPTQAAAKAWRQDAAVALRKGTMRAPEKTTLREAAAEWVEGARTGAVRTRSGTRYKPSTLRGYEQALRDFVLPELGVARLSDVRRVDLQRFADRLRGTGMDASTIRNAIAPVRAIYRLAVRDERVAVNPTSGLELPAPEGRRDRIVDPCEAAALLAALREQDRAVWACAFYAGLRAGELLALRWEDVDLGAGVIRVERSWDAKSREYVTPKSKAGRRTVPIFGPLRPYLAAHRLRQGRLHGLVFGRSAEEPLDARALVRRAATDWKRAELAPIGLHEARHSFASTLIAAGVNAKSISAYMGHASITITYDRYGHLMRGNEEEAVERVDAYHARRAMGAQAD